MSKLDKIIIGIRDSKLSHAQTDILLNQLISASVNLNSNTFDIKTIKTKGDIHVSQRLDRIGGKGLFIKEIEQHIIDCKIDVGIHSMKDVPAIDNPNDLEIICWLKRENYRDGLLSNSGHKFFDLPSGSIIGTSSIRRRAQILSQRKDLKVKLLRGNVDTRIKKLRNKSYDAIILSLAGLKRLGLLDHVTEELDDEQFLPAACQGTVGVQSKRGSHLKDIFALINHNETEIESLAEREVLKNINANCNSPVSVYAKTAAGIISIKCDILDHDGCKLFSKKISDAKDKYLKIANALSEMILNDLGQDKINKLDELNDFDYTPST